MSSLSGTGIYRRASQGVAYCLDRPGWNFFSDSPLSLVQR